MWQEAVRNPQEWQGQSGGVTEVQLPLHLIATEQHIRSILKTRRARDRFFDAELFADPAWDMLLELYAAELGQRRMFVSSLCIGSNGPMTTALRWIKALEKRGLVHRTGDPMDRRRRYVSMTAAGREAMEAYFQAVPQTGLLI